MRMATSRLNVRAVLLIRDPRGIMNSRQSLPKTAFCAGAPDCERPENLCRDMVDDYWAAQKLAVQFPGRFAE